MYFSVLVHALWNTESGANLRHIDKVMMPMIEPRLPTIVAAVSNAMGSDGLHGV